MAAITAQLVKDLREKTGAGMMDCKNALNATDGDMEAAIDWLRKKGLSQAAKKSSRVAAEGLVGVATAGNAGAVIEINAETDFVARNVLFQDFVDSAAKIALEVKGDLEALKGKPHPGESRTVGEQLTHLIATIGENMAIRRAAAIAVSDGVVSSYIHTAIRPGLGKIGVLVALESTGDKTKLAELGKQLAMHVAAAKPEALDTASVDPAVLEREKSIYRDQALQSGKPADIVEKMLVGRVRKYYEEVVLLEQAYILDDKMKISAVVEKLAKELGTPVKLAGFVRYGLGEGIQKGETDFAAEVAAMSGSK
ncbi:MAG: translation elongation factor Ts [Proteobacteria bacterium]|nr:translation elongation factor Ts [Pseudomonadota bacterium]